MWPIVCGTLAGLIAFVLTLRIVMGDDSETQELKSRLRSHGIEPRRFSNLCLTELIEVETRPLRLDQNPIDQALHRAIETVAVNVRNISIGTKDFTANDLNAQALQGRPNRFWEILKTHDPERFSLENLSETQSLYRVIAEERRRAR